MLEKEIFHDEELYDYIFFLKRFFKNGTAAQRAFVRKRKNECGAALYTNNGYGGKGAGNKKDDSQRKIFGRVL